MQKFSDFTLFFINIQEDMKNSYADVNHFYSRLMLRLVGVQWSSMSVPSSA